MMVRWTSAVFRPATLLAVLGSALGLPLLAQDQLELRHYGIRDGLSQSFVHVALQDTTGFMWFGTQSGLNRFDGRSFQAFTRDVGNPGSLAHDSVKALLEDGNGTLWVGTEGGGLGRFDPATDLFHHHRHDPLDPTTIPSDRVRVLFEDSQGRLWVGTEDAGLALFDRETGTFSRLLGDRFGAHTVEAIAEHQGMLWIAFDGHGLVQADLEGEILEELTPESSDLPTSRVRSLIVGREGRLWIATADQGVASLDGQGRLTLFQARDDAARLPSNETYALLEDRSGTIWVGTRRGIARIDASTGRILVDQKRPGDLTSLPHDRVVSLYQDRGDVVWIGTYAGLSTWNPRSASFRTYRQESSSGGLRDNFVASFADGEEDEVWVGTYGGGLSLLVDGERRFKDVDWIEALVPDDRIMALLYLRDERALLIGTFSSGLTMVDVDDRTARRFTHAPTDSRSIPADSVTSLLRRRDGSIWVGSFHGGLSRFDSERGTFDRYVADDHQPGALSSSRVVALYEDQWERLWIGTYGGGLNLLDDRTGAFRVFRHDPEQPSSLSSDAPWGFAESSSGDFWVCTQGGGVSRWGGPDFERLNPRFERVTERDGLPSDIIYGILADEADRLWLTSDKGLARYTPETGEVRVFTSNHGLQSDEFNHGAFMASRNGRLYAGGVNGMSSFEPMAHRRQARSSRTVLTRVLKWDTEFKSSDAVADLQSLDLKYNDDVLTFEFANLDYASPENNRYQYMLSGFRDGWIDLGTHNRVSFTNLDPGAYTFRVRSSSNGGPWNEEELELGLVVASPPWAKPWAFAGYALLGGVAALRVAASQKRKRRHAAQLERTNDELQDEVRERKAKERALEREREMVQQYLDVAAVIVIVVNEHKRILKVNHKGCETLGLPGREIRGRLLSDFISSADRRTLEARLLRPAASDDFELSLSSSRGESHQIAWRTASITLEDGSRAILLSGLDITRLRNLAQERDIAERASLAKSRFLANMSHEVRTPMGGILGMLELLLRSKLPPTEMRYAATAERAAKGLLGVLNDVLDFSKIEAGKLEIEEVPFELRSTVSDVMNLFAENAESKGVRLELAVDPSLPTVVVGDPTRLRQILTNLVGNAVKFTTDGVVAASATWSRTGRIRFEVQDDGPGIREEDQERIFLPFDQATAAASRENGGTGLGLAICRHLTELMGGSIAVRSTLGGGAAFVVELPLAASSERAADSSSKVLQLQRHSGRVLLAEDSSVMREVAGEMLRMLGMDVLIAHDGSEAVAAALGEDIDLVLMDCQMPILDGYGATVQIREAGITTPIVAMTANAMAGDREKCLAVGMDDYVGKPFSIGELSAALQRWLGPPQESHGPGLAGLHSAPSCNIRAALEELRQINDSPEFVVRVAERFMESSTATTQLALTAVSEEDRETLRRVAHTLKSSAQMLGATRLSQLSRELERAAGSTPQTELVDMVDEITREHAVTCGRVEDAVESLAG